MKLKQVRIVAAFAAALIIVVGVVIYQQFTTTTYKAVLDNVIPENRNVQSITIRYCNPEQNNNQDKTMTLTDQGDIDTILTRPAAMELKKASMDTPPLYLLQFQLDDQPLATFSVTNQDKLKTTGERPTFSGKETYQIQGENQLVQAIEAHEAQWEAIDPDTGSLDAGTLYHSCQHDIEQ